MRWPAGYLLAAAGQVPALAAAALRQRFLYPEPRVREGLALAGCCHRDARRFGWAA